MSIRKALIGDLGMVRNIVRTTINEVYPKYYPQGAVEFFLEYHSDESILSDIKGKVILLLEDKGNTVATGSIEGNSVKRLFVLPDFQGMGYGMALMDEIEKTIFTYHDEIVLEASFPAYSFYHKRGYQNLDFKKIETKSGDMLCYHLMKKIRNSNI